VSELDLQSCACMPDWSIGRYEGGKHKPTALLLPLSTISLTMNSSMTSPLAEMITPAAEPWAHIPINYTNELVSLVQHTSTVWPCDPAPCRWDIVASQRTLTYERRTVVFHACAVSAIPCAQSYIQCVHIMVMRGTHHSHEPNPFD
jgi:hypothetical protein